MANGQYGIALNNHFQKTNRPDAITWEEKYEGLPHDLTWTASCKVNGEVLGTASARRLREAREMAAEIACQALGISV